MQNESEVGQIQFSLFWLTVYIIYKAAFYNRPHWNWPIFPQIQAVKGLQKQQETKEISALFSYIFKSVFASSKLFCFITSHTVMKPTH